MPICSAGAQPKPAALAAYHFDPQYLFSLLGSGWEWARPYLAFMQPFDIADLPTYCNTEPTGWPTLTGLDWAGVLSGGRTGLAQLALQALGEAIHEAAWYELCQCVVEGPQAQPSAPSAPTNLPAINPFPTVQPSGGVPCRVFSTTHTFTPAQNGTIQALMTMDMSDLAVTRVDLFTKETQHGFTLGRTLDMAWSFVSGPNPPATFNPSGSTLYAPGPGLSGTTTLTPAANSPVFRMWGAPSVASGFSIDMDITITAYCGGSTPGVAPQPCCPPDQYSTGLLNQILSLVTLQQRQTNAFAYVSGAVHHSLTGSGTLAVSGILGALLNVSGLSTYSYEGGDPVTYFGVGDIRFGTNDGYTASVRIDTDSQVIFPESAGLYTVIAYNLNPGVTMTLTELLREA